MKHWTLDDIAWDRFDRGKVDPDLLRIVKAASLVEHNGADYATYLCNVFDDDPEFQDAAHHWARGGGPARRGAGALGRAGRSRAGTSTPRFKRFTDGTSCRSTRPSPCAARAPAS